MITIKYLIISCFIQCIINPSEAWGTKSGNVSVTIQSSDAEYVRLGNEKCTGMQLSLNIKWKFKRNPMGKVDYIEPYFEPTVKVTGSKVYCEKRDKYFHYLNYCYAKAPINRQNNNPYFTVNYSFQVFHRNKKVSSGKHVIMKRHNGTLKYHWPLSGAFHVKKNTKLENYSIKLTIDKVESDTGYVCSKAVGSVSEKAREKKKEEKKESTKKVPEEVKKTRRTQNRPTSNRAAENAEMKRKMREVSRKAYQREIARYNARVKSRALKIRNSKNRTSRNKINYRKSSKTYRYNKKTKYGNSTIRTKYARRHNLAQEKLRRSIAASKAKANIARIRANAKIAKIKIISNAVVGIAGQIIAQR
jgi:hypothetical protein